MPLSNNTYTTQQLVTNANLNNPVPGLSASDSFTIGVTKGGTTTNVPIDLSQVQGPLTLGNIVSYINSPAFRRRLLHPLPEDRDGRHRRPPTPPPPTGFRSFPAATRQISLSAASTPAL